MKNVAIADLSTDELRASDFVSRYLRYHGYRVIAVNPRAAEILDLPCYPTLGDIPEPVDLVNVFRLPGAVPSITRDAVTIGAKCLWLQFDMISQEGADIAAADGMDVVIDRCIKLEHARYRGRMHWLGLNTGRISARRAKAG